MPLFIIAIVLLWAIFGSPKKDVANWIYERDAAPWEEVDAFYYKDRTDLSQYVVRRNLKSVKECQDWVFDQAYRNQDGSMSRGTYECAIGYVGGDFAGMNVYRQTVQ